MTDKSEKPKRKPNSWIVATQMWNKEKGGCYCVPKKGTSDYNEVKKIQNRLKLEVLKKPLANILEKESKKVKKSEKPKKEKKGEKSKIKSPEDIQSEIDSILKRVEAEASSTDKVSKEMQKDMNKIKDLRLERLRLIKKKKKEAKEAQKAKEVKN